MMEQTLQRKLKNRHIQMISLGGSIGTGIFLVSAKNIASTGPSLLLSYILGGLAIFIIMRPLGKIAVEEPVTGSFSYYANKYLGPFAGFFTGWNFWFALKQLYQKQIGKLS